MLFCQKCQKLVPSESFAEQDGKVRYRCKDCHSEIPIRNGLKAGDIIAGFSIEREIGRGAMGIVYLARQTNLDREVAIKILSEEIACDELYVQRFFREARSAASLSHPNIVQAYDAGVTNDGIYYFVMELISGQNLNLVLQRGGAMPYQKALPLFIMVADALADAWKRQTLSHGDIKPENIILQQNGSVKLADFGLARRFTDSDASSEEDIRATPAYAPPEIINAVSGIPGFKSDMYSFGATIYHVLAGRVPFSGDNPVKVCEMQVSATQTPLKELNPSIPESISDFVDVLMRKKPEERPVSWETVKKELQLILQKEIESDLQESFDDTAEVNENKKIFHSSRHNVQSWNQKKSAPVLAISLGIAFILLAVFGILFLSNRNSSAPVPEIDEEKESGENLSFYKAQWSLLKSKYNSKPDLQSVKRFLAQAGEFAPEEAVLMHNELVVQEEEKRKEENLKKKQDEILSESVFLSARNTLLDEATAFFENPPEDNMSPEEVEVLLDDVLERYELLQHGAKLHKDLLSDKFVQTIEAYIDALEDIWNGKSFTDEKQQLKKSTAAAQGSSEKTSESATSSASQKDDLTAILEGLGDEKNDDDASSASRNSTTSVKRMSAQEILAETERTEKWLKYLDSLPSTIGTSSAAQASRAEAFKKAEQFLNDNKQSEDIRKTANDLYYLFSIAQKDLLSFIIADKQVLKGQAIFKYSNPNSKLEDINGKNIKMKFTDPENGAVVIENPSWNSLKQKEREERIVVNIISLPVFSKLSASFKEYLFARALFAIEQQDAIRNRFRKASALPIDALEHLFMIGDLFLKKESPEDEISVLLNNISSAETTSNSSSTGSISSPLLRRAGNSPARSSSQDIDLDDVLDAAQDIVDELRQQRNQRLRNRREQQNSLRQRRTRNND